MNVDWGTVPEWLSGSASVLALVLAAFAARAAWRSSGLQASELKHLQRLEMERVGDAEKSQARQVSAWIRFDSAGMPVVVCRNGSDLPVYKLNLTCAYGAASTVSVEYSVKGPDASPKELGYATARLRDNAAVALTAAEWGSLYESDLLSVEIRFKDAAGKAWRRDRFGGLVRTS